MEYEINVAKNGSHYFATHRRSLIGEDVAFKAFKDFKKRFPEKEGFSISISKNPRVSYIVTDEFEEKLNAEIKGKEIL